MVECTDFHPPCNYVIFATERRTEKSKSSMQTALMFWSNDKPYQGMFASQNDCCVYARFHLCSLPETPLKRQRLVRGLLQVMASFTWRTSISLPKQSTCEPTVLSIDNLLDRQGRGSLPGSLWITSGNMTFVDESHYPCCNTGQLEKRSKGNSSLNNCVVTWLHALARFQGHQE